GRREATPVPAGFAHVRTLPKSERLADHCGPCRPMASTRIHAKWRDVTRRTAVWRMPGGRGGFPGLPTGSCRAELPPRCGRARPVGLGRRRWEAAMSESHEAVIRPRGVAGLRYLLRRSLGVSREAQHVVLMMLLATVVLWNQIENGVLYSVD